MGRKMSIDSSITADIKSAASDSFKDNIKMIEISKIKSSMDNFYSMSDVDILADDIERQGLKHNLVVVEDSDNLGTYFIKSGHRRFTAIQQLVKDNRYTSKYVPCLVDGSKTKDENILDLIMLNATTRVMSDSEIYKQYEVLKETLEHLKADGIKIKGRMRDKLAEALNVSSAQVGKIENIKHNAVDEVKEAVAKGDMSIATADTLAKLTEEEQSDMLAEKSAADITTNDVKKRKEKSEPVEKTTKPEVIENDAEDYENEVITDDEDVSETVTDDELVQELPLWYNDAMKGYIILAAEEASIKKEQIDALLDGMIKVLSSNDSIEAENKYLNY